MSGVKWLGPSSIDGSGSGSVIKLESVGSKKTCQTRLLKIMKIGYFTNIFRCLE